jgi:alpha-L-fucosidase
MHRTALRLMTAALAWTSVLHASSDTKNASPDPYAQETKEEHAARMAWWREAKFGLFIHWGVYAVPAGVHDGRDIPGIGEWIMLHGRIPVEVYKAYAPAFTAERYDPRAWARLARRAGMRYVVITSKHHDGFALFDSKVSDWDAVDAAGAKRDLLAPLARAVRREGLKFGLYYSQAQDWTHPGGAKMHGGDWDDAHRGDMDAYLRDIAAPQVEEILTQYRPDILWWDTPVGMSRERAATLIPYLRLVPGIIHNNRLGGGFGGDTETPEQHIPATGFKDRDWEVCMTMNDTWGYKSTDHAWKSVTTLLHMLSDIVSKGGNFLLNVGPTADGVIPQPSVERLEAVGAWMEVNGEAIYGTTASPFPALPWGRCTKKLNRRGASLYLHVFEWPKDGRLVVPGLRNEVRSARMLAGGGRLKAAQTEEGVVLEVPAAAPDPHVSVIRLDVQGELDIRAPAVRQDAQGGIALPAAAAVLHHPGGSPQLRLETKDGRPNLGYWTESGDAARWTFIVHTPGVFELAIDHAGMGRTAWTWAAAGEKGTAAVDATGSYETFRTTAAGRVTIRDAGSHTFELRPVPEDWKPANVRAVTLTPAPHREGMP